MNLSTEQFGIAADGAGVELFTLINGHGMELRITNYGGKRRQSLRKACRLLLRDPALS